MVDSKAARISAAASSSGFSLTKWYLDVVGERQDVYIGYWLALAWHNLRLQGHHQLLRTAHDGVSSHGGLGVLPPPDVEGDGRVRWQSDGATGLWTAAADSIGATLFQSELGEIRWQCLMPKARSEVHLSDRSIHGWGYVERIDMTVPVWSLPFERLYWGRCHTANHYLVWIQTSGASSQSLAWHNGRLLADLVISDTLIRTSECRLTIEQRVPLRQGPIISTIFAPLKEVTSLLPRPAFMADERKWLGQGTLHLDDLSEPATILYEEVTW